VTLESAGLAFLGWIREDLQLLLVGLFPPVAPSNLLELTIALSDVGLSLISQNSCTQLAMC